MKKSRKEELIACCNAIARNADYIVEDMGNYKSVQIIIEFVPGLLPEVTFSKKFLPQEVLEIINGGNNG